MTLTDYIIDESIELDVLPDIKYDFYYNHNIEDFAATVSFRLADTPMLNTIADRIRRDAGYTPLYDAGMILHMGYYLFEYGLDDASEILPGAFIRFALQSSRMDDDGVPYIIPLGEEERRAIRNVLDGQFKKKVNLDCQELIEISRSKIFCKEDWRTNK